MAVQDDMRSLFSDLSLIPECWFCQGGGHTLTRVVAVDSHILKLAVPLERQLRHRSVQASHSHDQAGNMLWGPRDCLPVSHLYQFLRYSLQVKPELASTAIDPKT